MGNKKKINKKASIIMKDRKTHGTKLKLKDIMNTITL